MDARASVEENHEHPAVQLKCANIFELSRLCISLRFSLVLVSMVNIRSVTVAMDETSMFVCVSVGFA